MGKSRMMSLDEALLYRHYSNHKRPSRWLLYGTIGLVVGAFLAFYTETAGCAIMLICIPIAVVGLIRLQIWNCRSWRYCDTLSHKADEFGCSRYVRAETLYGNYEDAVLAVWECQEAHMPGDCPLCGAQ